MPSFSTGKIPSEVLRRVVFNHLGVASDRVLCGPAVGEDAAVIDMGDRVLVAKANPITGAARHVGWFAVHINANDVATRGAKPLWFLCTIMLPEAAGETLLEEIMEDIHKACCEVGASLVGGHTECTPGLDRPILSGVMIGEAQKGRYVTTRSAEPGDDILLTKGAGIEGTGILATDLEERLQGKLNAETIKAAQAMLRQISVVPEALQAVEAGGVSSMHTPTEGGIIQGLWELAKAADVGVEAQEEAIPVAPETRKVCDALKVDPLRLLSSGALIIAAKPTKSSRIIDAITKIGVKATIIGKVTNAKNGMKMQTHGGGEVLIRAVEQDELYRIIKELS